MQDSGGGFDATPLWDKVKMTFLAHFYDQSLIDHGREAVRMESEKVFYTRAFFPPANSLKLFLFTANPLALCRASRGTGQGLITGCSKKPIHPPKKIF